MLTIVTLLCVAAALVNGNPSGGGNQLKYNIMEPTAVVDLAAVSSPVPKGQSIVDIFMENSDTFSTLITAAKVADLVDTLSTGGPFTLFAPTNDALFATLPEGALGKLLATPEDLKKVLLGHVVAGNYPVAYIRSGDLPTLNGGIIKIVVTNDGKVTADSAKIFGKELIAANGVIHTIDKVLLS